MYYEIFIMMRRNVLFDMVLGHGNNGLGAYGVDLVHNWEPE